MIADIMKEMIKNMNLSIEEAKHAKKLIEAYSKKNAKTEQAEIREAQEIFINNFKDTKLKGAL